MFARNMTSRGKQIAIIFGLLMGFAFPKRVECGYPARSGKCTHPSTGAIQKTCTDYEFEPFAFFLIEKLIGDDFGFAYTSGEDCR
jgi:hypothetical protein